MLRKAITAALFICILIVFSALPGLSKAKYSADYISGINDWDLPSNATTVLQLNGFVVVPGRSKEMSDIYDECEKSDRPIFVTSDSVLHTSHIFFDYLLRIIEIEKLSGAAEDLTDRMLSLSEDQYDEAKDPDVKEAARLNIGFFSVAKRLFDPTFEVGYELNDLVNEELSNIDKHDGIKKRALLTYIQAPDPMSTPYAFEDYTQYVPRGHYTRNVTFEKYFKVMMWYGRLGFVLRPGNEELDVLYGRKMTLQALLIADALMKDKESYKLWKSIYEPTCYFVGKSDDLSIDDYASIMNDVFPPDGTVDKYAEATDISSFIDKALQLTSPKILSSITVVQKGAPEITSKGFRFMGQRYIPDSHIMQELVYGMKEMTFTGGGKPFTMENIPNVGPARAFPRGLDVLASLGSKRALEILEGEGDTDYKYYYDQLGEIQDEFNTLSDDAWKQNLYFRWIYSLLPLLDDLKGKKVPLFMQGNAWLDKELNASLGSWAELRHDTILYAKQSYTNLASSAMPQEHPKTYGYVEPYPEVYGRIAEMMGDIKNNLSDLGITSEVIAQKLDAFVSLLTDLKSISEKELKGDALSDDEYGVIAGIGGSLADLKDFPPDIMDEIADKDVDSRVDLVADVHTDPNTSQVLEEGVGSPSYAYVVIDDSKGPRLCLGPVFSYYEFKHPMDDRLTDEKWQKMGEDGSRPDLPKWTSAFTSSPAK